MTYGDFIDIAEDVATWRGEGKTSRDVSRSPPVGPFRRPQHTPPLCCLLCHLYHQTSKMVSVPPTHYHHHGVPHSPGSTPRAVNVECAQREGINSTNCRHVFVGHRLLSGNSAHLCLDAEESQAPRAAIQATPRQ